MTAVFFMVSILLICQDTFQLAQKFVKAWHRAEKGMPPAQPVELIYVQDLKTLLRFLTP